MVQNTSTQSIPYKGEGTINIHINNPSAGTNSVPQMIMPVYYPLYYPLYYYPQNYYLNNGINKNITDQLKNITAMQTLQQQKNGNSPNTPAKPEQGKYYQTLAQLGKENSQLLSQSIGYSNIPNIPPQTSLQQNRSLPNNKENENLYLQTSQTIPQKSLIQNKQAKPVNKKEIVLLTDEYIKNLENYLRNPNLQFRQKAMKEVLDRFKEQPSRLKDPALTALLNLGLQDIDITIKALAMSILDAGYASGDETTKTILKNMQKSNNNYSQDAIWATNTLLKMSQKKALVDDIPVINKVKG